MRSVLHIPKKDNDEINQGSIQQTFVAMINQSNRGAPPDSSRKHFQWILIVTVHLNIGFTFATHTQLIQY